MSLTAELKVANSESSVQYSFGDTLVSAEWSTQLFDQPGKLTFDIIDPANKMFFEGSNVILEVNSQKVFDGYVFTRKRTQNDTMQVVAYDRLRYLQNKDSRVFENATPSEIFSTLCNSQGLPYKITNGSNYRTASIAHDNTSLAAMIKRALDETLIATGKYLIVRDNVGVLEMVDIETLITTALIGDESLLQGFDFEASIDSNTYNFIKLVQENSQTGMRDVYIVKDSNTIYKWGQLQYFEKVDEDMNDAQIRSKANQLLSLYNRKSRSLKISCLGDLRITAGSGIGVSIKKLAPEEVAQMQYMFVSSCTHKLSKGEHTMSLTLEVV